MKEMSSPALARALLALVLALALPRGCPALRPQWLLNHAPARGPSSWFTQKLDHFSPTDKRTFQQRYFEVLDFASGPDCPIVIYICGEAPCGGVPQNFALMLARNWGGAAVALEHRYYGESMPFADISTEHLQYLSTHQALADLASFRQYYQERFCQAVGRGLRGPLCGGNKWVVVGGSYAGAMSAWLRLKYPHLFHASLASSAVVDVILDFYQFDEQVLESAGQDCGPLLQKVSSQAEDLLRTDREAVLALFGAQGMPFRDDRDFLFLVADAAVFGFQYGRPDAVCLPLLAAKDKGQDLLPVFAAYARDVFFGYFGSSPADYDQDALKNTTISSRSGQRTWWYQCCTEMAYFQTAPPKNSIRSARINMEYWKDFCSNVFGEGIFPDTDATNTFYGATNIAGSRIIFSNGSQDPWKRASKRQRTHGEPSLEVPCHNCGHCVDLRGCPANSTNLGFSGADACTDPGAVRMARRVIQDTLTQWLNEPADAYRHASPVATA